MILGTGIDLAEVPRIRASAERFGARFIERIYTPGEIAYVERKANRYERYAARSYPLPRYARRVSASVQRDPSGSA